MCEVLWPHTHVIVDVPCGYSFLFVNLKGGSGYSYSLSWSMHHVDFVRLGAKCDLCDHWKLYSSMVYATIKIFSHVRSMRPVIYIFYSLSVMVQCGNQYSLLITLIVYVLLEFAIFCELVENRKNVIKY